MIYFIIWLCVIVAIVGFIVLLNVIDRYTYIPCDTLEFCACLSIIIPIIVGFYLTYKTDTRLNLDVTTEIDGKYYDEFPSIEDVTVKITAEVSDGKVKRTSSYNLKGTDFNKNELDNTNKAFTNLVINMLKDRQNQIDSAKTYYTKNAGFSTNGCKLTTSGKHNYWICLAE